MEEEVLERIDAIQGYLLVVDFREDHYRCEIYAEDSDKCIPCTFDEDTEDAIAQAMRHLVYAIGISGRHPQSGELLEFHIKQIFDLSVKEKNPEELQSALAQYREANDTAAKFKRSWREVREGKTYPISQLWDDIDAE